MNTTIAYAEIPVTEWPRCGAYNGVCVHRASAVVSDCYHKPRFRCPYHAGVTSYCGTEEEIDFTARYSPEVRMALGKWLRKERKRIEKIVTQADEQLRALEKRVRELHGITGGELSLPLEGECDA